MSFRKFVVVTFCATLGPCVSFADELSAALKTEYDTMIELWAGAHKNNLGAEINLTFRRTLPDDDPLTYCKLELTQDIAPKRAGKPLRKYLFSMDMTQSDSRIARLEEQVFGSIYHTGKENLMYLGASFRDDIYNSFTPIDCSDEKIVSASNTVSNCRFFSPIVIDEDDLRVKMRTAVTELQATCRDVSFANSHEDAQTPAVLFHIDLMGTSTPDPTDFAGAIMCATEVDQVQLMTNLPQFFRFDVGNLSTLYDDVTLASLDQLNDNCDTILTSVEVAKALVAQLGPSHDFAYITPTE